jgi:hypothetical protein
MGWFKKCKCSEKVSQKSATVSYDTFTTMWQDRILQLEKQVRELQSCIPTTYEVESDLHPWNPKFFIQRNKAGRKSRTLATFDSHEEATEALKLAEKFEYVALPQDLNLASYNGVPFQADQYTGYNRLYASLGGGLGNDIGGVMAKGLY